jgi:hypothetical protein
MYKWEIYDNCALDLMFGSLYNYSIITFFIIYFIYAKTITYSF